MPVFNKIDALPKINCFDNNHIITKWTKNIFFLLNKAKQQKMWTTNFQWKSLKYYNFHVKY